MSEFTHTNFHSAGLPCLGVTVEEVLKAFAERTLEQRGRGYVEALVLFASHGGNRRMRWSQQGLLVVLPWVGSQHGGRLADVRQATEREECELRDGLLEGTVQIEVFDSQAGTFDVLHRASGVRLNSVVSTGNPAHQASDRAPQSACARL